MKSYDLAIIGSGPGGYVAALYAARHKLNVCLIEKDLVGGTCLNRGCIPTKSLLYSASFLKTINAAPGFGVEIEGRVRADFPKMISRKNEVVSHLRIGLETLFRASKIDLIKGAASITGKNTISVDGADTLEARNIIIGAGSSVMWLPGLEASHPSILSSDTILDLQAVPQSICVIGGGVVGCEFADLFNTLGSRVTVIELMDRLLPTQSREVSKKLEIIFKKKGIAVFTSSKVEKVEHGKPLKVKISDGVEVAAEKVLVAVGRKPNTSGLGLEEAGIRSEKARIMVDEGLCTDVPGIYAIGDCVVGPPLAHKASYDGILACDNIMGKKRRADYSAIPSSIWTDPQIASVGLTEDEARARLANVKVAKFPYLASGKAYLLGKSEGFIKIIGNTEGDILGVEIFGEEACELIGEAVLAKASGVKIQDWAHSVHPHPTLSEIIQEAAHIFCGAGIHTV